MLQHLVRNDASDERNHLVMLGYMPGQTVWLDAVFDNCEWRRSVNTPDSHLTYVVL